MIKLKSDKPEAQVRKSIFAILEKTKLLSMATIKNAESWINTAYFAYSEDLELFIITNPSTVHGINLQNNPSVSVTVFDSHQTPGPGKQGLQLIGTGERVTDKAEELNGLKLWHDRVLGTEGFDEFEKEYLAKFKSKIHKLKVNHVKIFDEKTFGNETWVEVEVTRHGC